MANNMKSRFGKIANNPDTFNANLAPSIEMGITNAPSRLIVNFLTKMYAHPLEAAIRETVSNAIDATVKAGKAIDTINAGTREFDFGYTNSCDTYPINLDCFYVRDCGCGMDEDTLINVYTQYGVSDKRDDADATGAFGLGAKSPLAYNYEFHVITKAEDGVTRYIVCYQTEDGNFVADMPQSIEKKVACYRNDNDRLVPPMKDDNGNLATPAGATLREFDIEDPFNENETGTLVVFPVGDRWGSSEVDQAANIVKNIAALIYSCGDGKVTDRLDYSKIREYKKLLDTEIEDESGDTIPVRVFFAGSFVDNLYNWLLFEHSDNNDVYNKIGFKVGDWYYPISGSIWHDDSYFRPYANDTGYSEMRKSDIIIDVPSRALSFVPSRDAIIAENGNDNAMYIIEKCREALHDIVLSDPSFNTQFFNYCLVHNPHAFNSFTDMIKTRVFTTSWADNKHNTLNIKIDPYWKSIPFTSDTVQLDVNELIGFDNYKISDLLNTDPAFMGFIQRTRVNSKMIYGPVMALDDELGWVSGKPFILNGKCGFGLSGRKVSADALTGKGKKVYAADGITRAFGTKNEVKSDKFTPSFPAGIAFMNYEGFAERKANNIEKFAIIDASKIGISRVRSGIGRVFDNIVWNNDDTDQASGFFAVIPPKYGDSTKNWTKKEIKQQVETLTNFAESVFDNAEVVYIDCNKIESGLAKKNTDNAVARDELTKMLNVHRVIEVNHDYNYGSKVWTGRGDAVKNAKQLVSDADTSGVIICNDYSDNVRGYEVAADYAEAVIALDIIPKNIDKIYCVSSRHFNQERAALLIANGIEVIYDATDTVPAVIPTDNLYFQRGNRNIAYNGLINEDVLTYIINKEEKMNRDSINSKLREIFGTVYSWNHRSINYAENFLSVATFGHRELPSCGIAPEFINYRTNVLDKIKLDTHYDNDYSEIEKELEEIKKIWNSVLEHCPMRLDANCGSEDSRENAKWIQKFGEWAGIKEIVDAYYKGVPVEDLI